MPGQVTEFYYHIVNTNHKTLDASVSTFPMPSTNRSPHTTISIPLSHQPLLHTLTSISEYIGLNALILNVSPIDIFFTPNLTNLFILPLSSPNAVEYATFPSLVRQNDHYTLQNSNTNTDFFLHTRTHTRTHTHTQTCQTLTKSLPLYLNLHALQ